MTPGASAGRSASLEPSPCDEARRFLVQCQALSLRTGHLALPQPCRGFACSPNTPIRVQLASQEANAAALLGHAGRTREALARAEQAAELVTPDSGLSA